VIDLACSNATLVPKSAAVALRLDMANADVTIFRRESAFPLAHYHSIGHKVENTCLSCTINRTCCKADAIEIPEMNAIVRLTMFCIQM
jgi:hypothetical protein